MIDDVVAPTLQLQGVSKRWHRMARPVLDGIDLSLAAGTAVLLTARNGAGKTTLPRVASGLITPDGGDVRVRGLSPERSRREFHRQVMHASAVQGATEVTAFAAFSGGGKSSVARQLMSRGALLFADDIIALPPADGELRAHPGPALINPPCQHGGHDGVGEVIARFPGEDWVTVPRAARECDRIAAICLLGGSLVPRSH